MKFEQLLEKLGDQPMFDFAMVCTLFGEKKETVRTALSRLKRAGKILELKRGLYTFAEPYRRATLNAAYLMQRISRICSMRLPISLSDGRFPGIV